MSAVITPTPPTPAGGDDAIGAALAGVYAAKPDRLLVGPLLHLQHFIQAPTGASFGRARLPPPSSRYVVDCAPHACDIPPLPRYATASSPTRRSGGNGSTGASLRMSCGSAAGAMAANTPRTSPPCTPPASRPLTGAAEGPGGAFLSTSSSPAFPAVTHPAQMSLATRVRSPSPPLASPVQHTRSAAGAAAASAADSLDVVHISTEEAVARMNSNASDFLEKLRQRCEVNGMAARGVSLVRRVNLVASPMQSSHSRAGSPPAGAASASSFTVTSPTRPSHADPACDVPLFASGSGVPGASSSAAAAVASSQPEFTASSPVLSQLRPQPPASTAMATAVPLPGLNAALLRDAELNDEMTHTAEVTCGAGHVITCPVPLTDDSLDSAAVQAALQRIAEVLASDPDAVVYVYSLHGKGTASAVATLYLVQVERVSLTEALEQRLPKCTPRMSCLVQLLERDPSPGAFDRVAYLRRYLARRHPTASVTGVEVAVEACKGDYAKAERLIRSELAFQAVDGVLAGRTTGRSGSGTLSGSTSASSPPLALNGSGGAVNGGGSPAAPHLRVGRAASRVSCNSASNFSITSAAARDLLILTDGDETIIDSLHAALVEGGVAATRAEVRESYLQHRRAQDMVLRQFLLRLKTSVTLSPPRRARPEPCGDGDATPPANALEPIVLPNFEPASGSRKVSSTTTTPATFTTPRSRPPKTTQQPQQRTALRKAPVPFALDGDGGATSPEPRRPRVASARTPASPPQPPTPKKSAAAKSTSKPALQLKAAAVARPRAEKVVAAHATPKANATTPSKAKLKGRPSS